MSWSLCRVGADVTAPRGRCASVLTRPFSRTPLSPPPCSSHAPASPCRGCPSPRAWRCGPGSSARTSPTRSLTATTPSCWGRASYASATAPVAPTSASCAAPAAPASAASTAPAAPVAPAPTAASRDLCCGGWFCCVLLVNSRSTATIDVTASASPSASASASASAFTSAAVSAAARSTDCSCCLLHGRCSYSCTCSPATLLHVRVAVHAPVHDHGPTS